MTWQQTHRRWRVLTEIEAAVAARPLDPLSWDDDWADLFGDPAGLVAHLRYRWRLRLAEPAVDDVHRDHPARTVARVGLAALDLQEARHAAA